MILTIVQNQKQKKCWKVGPPKDTNERPASVNQREDPEDFRVVKYVVLYDEHEVKVLKHEEKWSKSEVN